MFRKEHCSSGHIDSSLMVSPLNIDVLITQAYFSASSCCSVVRLVHSGDALALLILGIAPPVVVGDKEARGYLVLASWTTDLVLQICRSMFESLRREFLVP